MSLTEPITFVVFVLFLSAVIEAVVEYVFGILFDNIPNIATFSWLLKYIALGVAIAATVIYKLDMISHLAKLTGFEIAPGILGYILTGAMIGSGSSKLHQFISKYFPGSYERFGEK